MKICSKNMTITTELKKKTEMTMGIKNIEITYIPGNLIIFDITNMDYINPSKIIIKKSGKEIVVLFYGEYYYEEDAIFIYDIHNKYTWNKLR